MKRFAALFLLFSGMAYGQVVFNLNLTVHNPPKGMQVIVREYSLLQNQHPALDTLYLNKGAYKANPNLEEGIYQLHLTGLARVPFAVEAGKTVGIVVDNRLKKGPEIFYDGSMIADMMQEYELLRKKLFKKNIEPVREKISRALKDGNDEELAVLTAKEDAQTKAYRAKLAEFAQNYLKKNIVFLYATIRMDQRHLPLMREQLNWFRENKPDLKQLPQLEEKIEVMSRLGLSSIAPEIALPDPSGEVQRLSELRGKYVLLDFWASWCLPCRRENPNYVRLNERFAGDNFEIYSVGLETNKTLWQQAIARDGMNWTHVSDLEGWASEAARTYNITAIPANFLLDPSGKIIARDVRGIALEKKLLQVLKN